MTTKVSVQTRNSNDPMVVEIASYEATTRHTAFKTVTIKLPDSGTEVVLFPKTETLEELVAMFPTATVYKYPQEFVDNA